MNEDNKLAEAVCKFLTLKFTSMEFRINPHIATGLIEFNIRRNLGASGWINVESGSINFDEETSGTCQEIVLLGKMADTVEALLKMHKTLLKI